MRAYIDEGLHQSDRLADALIAGVSGEQLTLLYHVAPSGCRTALVETPDVRIPQYDVLGRQVSVLR